jgi:hypothetical protein
VRPQGRLIARAVRGEHNQLVAARGRHEQKRLLEVEVVDRSAYREPGPVEFTVGPGQLRGNRGHPAMDPCLVVDAGVACVQRLLTSYQMNHSLTQAGQLAPRLLQLALRR